MLQVIGPISVLLVILFCFIMPFALGMITERMFIKSGEGIRFSRCFLLGFTIILASFLPVATPLIHFGVSFYTLLFIYGGILIGLLLVSFLLNAKSAVKNIKNSCAGIITQIKEFDRERKLFWVLTAVMIVFQTALLVFRMHVDTDDTRFLSEALEAIEKNTLLRYHPITGEMLSYPYGEMVKDMYSPYPILISVFSVLTRLHPTVFAHSVLPIFLVPLSYAAFFVLGDYFFGNTNKRTMYMFILSSVLLFSFESLYSLGYTLLAIIWQGRSIFATVMLPLLWYYLMRIYMGVNMRESYILLFILSMASQCLSGTAALVSVVLGLGFVAGSFIKNKKLKDALLIIICQMPCYYETVCYSIPKILNVLGRYLK